MVLLMEEPFGAFLAPLINHALGRTYLRAFGWPFVGQRVETDIALSLLGAERGEGVLDAGCGLGIYSIHLARKGVEVMGVDIDPDQISLARQWAKKLGIQGVTFEVQDVCCLPYEGQVFDKVLCVAVIEHVPDDEKAVKEVSRVLKAGGVLSLTTATPLRFQTSFFHRDTLEAVGHVRQGYTFKELHKLLERNNLRITDVGYYDRFFERFTGEVSTTLFHKVGGGERAFLEAHLKGSIGAAKKFIPFLATFPLLHALAKLDKLFPLRVEKNCIAVKAVKT